MSYNYTILKHNNKILSMSSNIYNTEQSDLLRDLRKANNFSENELASKAKAVLESMGYESKQAEISAKRFAKKYSKRKKLHTT